MHPTSTAAYPTKRKSYIKDTPRCVMPLSNQKIIESMDLSDRRKISRSHTHLTKYDTPIKLQSNSTSLLKYIENRMNQFKMPGIRPVDRKIRILPSSSIMRNVQVESLSRKGGGFVAPSKECALLRSKHTAQISQRILNNPWVKGSATRLLEKPRQRTLTRHISNEVIDKLTNHL